MPEILFLTLSNFTIFVRFKSKAGSGETQQFLGLRAFVVGYAEEKPVFQRIEKLVKQQKFDMTIFVDYDKEMVTKILIEKIRRSTH